MLRMQEIAFPSIKFKIFFGGVCHQTTLRIHVWYVGHMAILTNILSHRKVPFQKMPLPTGKSLKKALIKSRTKLYMCTV
jgi:hypothetical protein